MVKRVAFFAMMAIVYPLSLVPSPLLYLLSDFVYGVLYYVIRYRRKIVYSNLRNSFPNKSNNDINSIAKKFYSNLCDIIVENIKLVSISKEEISKRCKFNNLELLDGLFKNEKSLIATLGHCGNWELAGLAASLAVKHHTITFYRPLKNIYFNKYAKKMRAKFGMELLPHNKARQMLRQDSNKSNMYIFITDQTPSNVFTSHWTTFLNQETPIFKGTEKFARITGHPVVYCDVQRTKRGYYSIEFNMLTENPVHEQPGKVTELHTRALENAIINNPDNWLWTHRRWKRKRPLNKNISLY